VGWGLGFGCLQFLSVLPPGFLVLLFARLRSLKKSAVYSLLVFLPSASLVSSFMSTRVDSFVDVPPEPFFLPLTSTFWSEIEAVLPA